MVLVFSYLVLYTFEFFNNFLVDERSHQARQFVVLDLKKNVLKVSYGDFCDFHRVSKKCI